MRRRVILPIIVLFCISFIGVNNAFAGTQVSGDVSGVWTAENSPYEVVGNLYVRNGDELVIEPGVTVDFQGRYFLNVINGSMRAMGTETDSIYFTTDTLSNPQRWLWILFSNTNNYCVLSHCKIEYTTDEYNATISASNCDLDVISCTISDNHKGTSIIRLYGSGTKRLINNLISNNSTTYNPIINCSNCSLEIRNNIIVNNSPIERGAVFCYESSPIVINNVICNNYCTESGGGIYIHKFSYPIIMNNIVWGNVASNGNGNQIYIFNSTSHPIIQYCDIQDGLNGIYNSQYVGSYDNNIELDPLFINPSTGAGAGYNGLLADWHLQDSSPCIDAGNPDSLYNDPEDPDNPGYAMYPAQGTIINDIGAYGGPWLYPNGTIEGNVTLADTTFGKGNVEDVTVIAGWQTTHPNSQGDYSMQIFAGIYDVTAELENYYSQTVDSVEIAIGQTISNINFVLEPITSSIEGTVVLEGNYGFIEEVEITAGDKTVHPDYSGHYKIIIEPGTYDVIAIYDWYYTQVIEDVVVIDDQTTSGIDFSLNPMLHNYPDWMCISSWQYSMVVMAIINLQGVYFEPTAEYDMSAGFGPNDTCRCIGLWTPECNIWYFVVWGNQNGDEISFRIYDTERDTIYYCNETVEFQANAVIGSPENPFELSTNGFPICSIQGTITDNEGNPIQLAEVVIRDNTVQTDVNGNYTIYVTPGTYNVTVSAIGFHSRLREKVSIDEGQNAEDVDFVLYDSSGPPEWTSFG